MALLFIFITLPFLTYFLLIKRLKRSLKTAKTGIDATAIIIHIEKTGLKIREGVNEFWEVVLDLEIEIPVEKPYPLSIKHLVPILEIPRFQPGKILEIKVDPSEKNKITIP